MTWVTINMENVGEMINVAIGLATWVPLIDGRWLMVWPKQGEVGSSHLKIARATNKARTASIEMRGEGIDEDLLLFIICYFCLFWKFRHEVILCKEWFYRGDIFCPRVHIRHVAFARFVLMYVVLFLGGGGEVMLMMKSITQALFRAMENSPCDWRWYDIRASLP